MKKLIVFLFIILLGFSYTGGPLTIKATETHFSFTFYNYYNNVSEINSGNINLQGSRHFVFDLRWSTYARFSNEVAITKIQFLNSSYVSVGSFNYADVYPTKTDVTQIGGLHDFDMDRYNVSQDAKYFRIYLALEKPAGSDSSFLAYMNESTYDIEPVENLGFFHNIDNMISDTYREIKFAYVPYDYYNGEDPGFWPDETFWVGWYIYNYQTNQNYLYYFDRPLSEYEYSEYATGQIKWVDFYPYYAYYKYAYYHVNLSVYGEPYGYEFKFLPEKEVEDPIIDGYQFVGWFDKNGKKYDFTNMVTPNQMTPGLLYNETPLTTEGTIYSGSTFYGGRFNLYARFTKELSGGALPGQDDYNVPDALAYLLDDFGLYNNNGFILVYFLLILIINATLLWAFKMDFMVLSIINLLITAVFMFMNLLPVVVSLLLSLFLGVSLFISVSKGVNI